MGRDRKNEAQGEHFTKMTRSLMQTPAWRAMSPTAQMLYLWLKLEWKGPQHNNNGRISLSVRQAADRIGISRNAAARAFHDLQAKGFIVAVERAHLGLSGEAKAPKYELTELPLPMGQSNQGRRLFREWRPGADFPVITASANNPTGKNGKSKTLSSK
jgi:hypothetical protein